MTIQINLENKSLFDKKTNQLVYPSCFVDLVAYHSYLISSKQAQQILRDAFDGKLVITHMIQSAQAAITY